MEEHGLPDNPPSATPDDWGRPSDGSGDPGLGLRGTWCLPTAMEEDTSQRGTTKMAMVQQLVTALEHDYIKLKGNLHLLWHWASAGRPEGEEDSSAIVSGPSIPTETERRLVPLETPSPGEDTWVEDLEKPTYHLPHCSAANLAFYLEWMELAQQPKTSPARCTKRLRWMVIQKLTSFYDCLINVLGGWRAGSNSSSCGPLQKGPIPTSSRHRCISGM